MPKDTLIHGAVDYYSQEIAGPKDYYSEEVAPKPNIPFGSKLSKFGFPVAGAVMGELTMGAPLTEIGAGLGTLVAPGPGTFIGGLLGAGAAGFLGATAGEGTRGELQARATHQPSPPFLNALKEAAPYGAFGVGGELAGAGLEATAPFLKEAPKAIRMFTRPGTIAQTATRAGAGTFTAGTTERMLQGEKLPQAISESSKEVPAGMVIGAGMQAVPSFLRVAAGKDVKTAGKAYFGEADKMVKSFREGNLPEYISTRGHQIWDRVKAVALEDKTPISLGDFVKASDAKFGVGSAQTETLLDAFGRSKAKVTGRTSAELRPNPEFLAAHGFTETEQQGAFAKIFEQEPISPEHALNTATFLGQKIKGGAKSAFRKGYSFQDSVNADARGVIYDVLKGRVSEEGKQVIDNALKEYGEFSVLRNEAHKVIQPFGNVQTPTESGIKFLTRLASGAQTAETPDDLRLMKFLKEATGNDPAAGLDKLYQDLRSAESNAKVARIVRSWVIKIGFAYPFIRGVLRGR